MSAARDALRSALAAQTSTTGPAALPTSPAVLSALAQRARARTLVGSDLDALAALADAAAVHGYPAPMLDRLGRSVAAVPTARTADPSTSKAAHPPTPRRTNHLGRLLLAFLERDATAERTGADHTMTSEEVARAAGLPERSEYAKRCSELQALGLLRVALDDDRHERTRKGGRGLQRLVFELTADGRDVARALDSERPADLR